MEIPMSMLGIGTILESCLAVKAPLRIVYDQNLQPNTWSYYDVTDFQTLKTAHVRIDTRYFVYSM